MPVHRRPLVLAALCLCAFAVNLDVTLVNVTLPRLTLDLGASTRDLQWVVDAYTLAFAALVLPAGSLGDRFGRREALLVGLVVYGVGNGLGGLTDSHGRAHRHARRHGRRRRDHLPDDALDHHERLHGARRAREGDRHLGRRDRRRDRARPDRRRRPARGVHVAGDLPREGARRARGDRARALGGPDLPRPGGPADRRPGAGTARRSPSAPRVFAIIEAPSLGWGSRADACPVLRWRPSSPCSSSPTSGAPPSRCSTCACSATCASRLRHWPSTVGFFALAGFIFLIIQYFQFLKGYGPLETGLRLLPVATSVAVGSRRRAPSSRCGAGRSSSSAAGSPA